MTTPNASTNLITRYIFWAMALVLGLATPAMTLAAGEPEGKGTLFGAVDIPAGVSATVVQDQIVATLLGRQWGVKSKADGEVVGYLKHRSNEATVTFSYDNAKVQIYCVGYRIDKTTGVREKPEQPAGWLKFLSHDLAANLYKATGQK